MEQRRNVKIIRKDAWLFTSIAALIVISSAAHLAFPGHYSPQKPVLIEGHRAVSLTRGDSKLWDTWISAASLAVDRWNGVLKDHQVPPIKLVADVGDCGPDAIACADRNTNTIYVASPREDVDRTTVMMHEIGHLLGVPHIEGDELMDKAYQAKPLEIPSINAISIANKGLTVQIRFDFETHKVVEAAK